MTFAFMAGTRRRLVILSAASLVLLATALLGGQAAGGAPSARSKPAQRDSAMTRRVRQATQSGADTANQPALVADAADAQAMAGSAYYTNAVVNDAANTVDVYLAGAPRHVRDAQRRH